MTQREYNAKKRSAMEKARSRQMKEEIKSIRRGNKRHLEASKVFIGGLILMCLQIILYT